MQVLLQRSHCIHNTLFDVDDVDAMDARSDLMMMMESGMKPSGFVVANYIDFNKVLHEEKKKIIFFMMLTLFVN